MMISKAQTYAAALAEWKRQATKADRIDDRGRPAQPCLRAPGDPFKILAEVDDDGELYTVGNWHSAEQARALAAFITEWYGAA